MEETINKKGIIAGDCVKIVLPKGINIGDVVGGYTILETMYNVNNSIVEVKCIGENDVLVEIKDTGLGYWFDNSCVQPLVEDCVPQFKVGDTVVITIPKEYNTDTHIPFDITKEMLGLNGTCTKITQIVKDRYKKSDFPEIDNLDGCKYYLKNNIWIWPNCLLTKVEPYNLDVISPYQKMEQEAITSLTSLTGLTSLTSDCKVDGCTSIYGTYTVKEAIQENKDLIKIKSKKLKLNFKN